jgi:transcription initiation factor TFIID TATA-box-binding protein
MNSVQTIGPTLGMSHHTLHLTAHALIGCVCISYEPELHPGATYRMKDIKAVLKVFQTGAITITAPSIGSVQSAVERIYPLVHEYRKPKPNQSTQSSSAAKLNGKKEPKKEPSKFLNDRDISDPEVSDEDIVMDGESEDSDVDPDYSDKSD